MIGASAFMSKYSLYHRLVSKSFHARYVKTAINNNTEFEEHAEGDKLSTHHHVAGANPVIDW